MREHHRWLLREIRKLSPKPVSNPALAHYLGNAHPLYHVRLPRLRAIVRAFFKAYPDLTNAHYRLLIGDLLRAPTSTEKILGGLCLDAGKRRREGVSPALFYGWLARVEGWAEVDGLCYGHFSGKEMLERWPEWRALLRRLVADKNIHRRRASMALLCKAVAHEKDGRLEREALHVLDTLHQEREPLITKGVSWLLRSMTRHYRDVVARYLDENADTLPSIAVRETRKKLLTGKKT